MQLFSDVQMLHLGAREDTQLSASFPPNPSRCRAAEPTPPSHQHWLPFSSLAEGHDLQQGNQQLETEVDLSSTQTWGNSSVNICNWLIFKIHTILCAID